MKKIKEILKEKKMSIKDLADKLEMNPTSLSRIINGIPTRDATLKRIAEAMGMTLDELYDQVGPILKPLDNNRMYIVKIITINASTPYGAQDIGYIMYEREFKEDYKFTESNTPANMFEEYPRQKDYPHDALDNLILKVIQDVYPNSRLHNKFVFFNTDLDYIERLKQPPAKELTIRMQPFVSDYKLLMARRIYQIELKFHFYQDFSFGAIRTDFFTSFSLDQEEEIAEQMKTFNEL
ncbi:helix-turn-helix transcriptional regulator [Bacteroides acidifaciens]|uniref:helix-turn-helix domain-containing protein n=1 Tax=Bacteroides acidifaciens TaxID=85831 RepID=UPI002149B0D5|nr:helix-turn-helix transcriptional regulator [Bacteroides acidifaciens]MCR2007769.1 helix-turn-helix transcriptional regulator [Bacteroides acidifaciens]